MDGTLADDWYTLRVSPAELQHLQEKCPPLIVRADNEHFQVGYATQEQANTARAALRG